MHVCSLPSVSEMRLHPSCCRRRTTKLPAQICRPSTYAQCRAGEHLCGHPQSLQPHVTRLCNGAIPLYPSMRGRAYYASSESTHRPHNRRPCRSILAPSFFRNCPQHLGHLSPTLIIMTIQSGRQDGFRLPASLHLRNSDGIVAGKRWQQLLGDEVRAWEWGSFDRSSGESSEEL